MRELVFFLYLNEFRGFFCYFSLTGNKTHKSNFNLVFIPGKNEPVNWIEQEKDDHVLCAYWETGGSFPQDNMNCLAFH